MPVNTPEKAQEMRDLRSQMSEIADDPQIVFKETSPRRRMGTIYSMIDGEPISVPMANIERVMEKKLPTGGFMFTSKKEEAPEYRLGEVKCFLHPESPERGVLQEVGLSGGFCSAAHLANSHSKRIHAEHRHSQEWKAYQEHIKEAKEREQIERQEAQLDATLAIAGRAAEAKPLEVMKCPDCDYEGSKQQVTGHKAAKHREANAGV